MSEDIYAKPDMTKKVKLDRGEMEERIVDIYVSADTLRDGETSTKREETEDTAPNNGPGDQHSEPDSSEKRPFLVAAVCLGLLCVLLLFGIIGLSVHYNGVSNSFLAYETKSTEERGQIQKERDQLQTSYNNLTKERNQLQTSYNNLTKERNQLQTSYNNLTKERDQLQTEREFLNRRLTNCKQTCPEGWQKFESSWYFLSTETKTWKESREDCVERGADLVITNSNEEQKFLFNLKKRVWIGLTDSVTEGTWRWVDDTPLTTPRYWGTGQPDDIGQEDCVEIFYGQYDPLKTWNDNNCESNQNWICEKAV